MSDEREMLETFFDQLKAHAVETDPDTALRILRLESELAAERAARRVAEARLNELRRYVGDEGSSAFLQSLRLQIGDFLDKHGPRPYDFKVDL